jgi:predicted DNA-binding transcriptional regulator YafY
MSRKPDPPIDSRRADRDRRVTQAERLRRVLGVLQLIQSRGRYNAKAIAQELGCSERTVYRDLEVLAFAGVPHYFDEVEQCYRVSSDCKLPSLPLSDAEAFGQAVAAVLGGDGALGIAGNAGPITRKLQAESDKSTQQVLADAATLIDAFNLQLADHSRCGEVIPAIQKALLGLRQLSGLYETPHKATPLRMTVHPYRLCFIKQAWYLVGRIEGEQEPKTLRVARFKSLKVIAKPSEVPVSFDLRGYFGNAWAVYRGNESFSVRIWFTPASASLVTETVWHRTQKVQRRPDGSAVLSFTVDGLEEIVRWVLGWTGEARVLEPPRLHEMIVERLEAAIEIHAKPFDI